jgi:hypothetical protein
MGMALGARPAAMNAPGTTPQSHYDHDGEEHGPEKQFLYLSHLDIISQRVYGYLCALCVSTVNFSCLIFLHHLSSKN